VDNEALDYEEETDVLSLIANESDESDEQYEEEDDAPTTLEEALALLGKEREIKSKRNKSLKKAKQAVHRTMEERDALSQRLDQLESRLNTQPNGEADKYEQQVQEWQERVADDPSQAVAYTNWMQKNMEDKVANYVGSEIHGLKQMIAELKGATDPEKIAYKSDIERLRSSDAFAELDDNALLAVAKAMKGTKVKNPRGSIGGGRAATDNQPFKMTDEMRIKFGFPPRGE
jgi:exonuclease VII large subunit